MKVQVPFDMVIREAFRKEPTPIDFYDAFKRGVYFGVDGVNDQLVATSPTKIPFVSDGEIIQRTDQLHNNSRTERMCFAAGATWARDKYEARNASIAPTPKKVLKRWVEIFQLEAKNPERTFLSLGVIALAKENLDKMAGKTREEIPGSETFPDEWFTEAPK